MTASTLLMIGAVIWFLIIPSFQDRVVPVNRLLITPAVFLYFFYQMVTKNFTLSMPNTLIIILGLVIGISVGILLRANTAIKADKAQKAVWLPGDFFGLITFLLIFAAYFAIGYLHAVSPDYLKGSSLGAQSLLLLTACVVSITAGANAQLYYKYLTSKVNEKLPIIKKPK